MKGETRPSRVNYNEPILPGVHGLDPPAGLRGPGLREWKRLAPILQESGILKETDLGVFEDYCRALSDLRTFEAKAKRVGAELSIAKGFQNAVLKLRSQVNALRRELGLSPTSRSSVKVSKPAGGIKNKLFLFQNRLHKNNPVKPHEDTSA